MGLGEDVKEKFWEEFEELAMGISGEERVVIGGDLNGHVGSTSDGYGEAHGGWGYGERNREGEVILEEATAQGLVVLNTMFKKEEKHLITYEVQSKKTQIDYFLTRLRDKGECKDCKVVRGEWDEGQHKVVVVDMVWKVEGASRRRTGMETVRWGKLKEKEAELCRSLMKVVNWEVNGSVQEMWGTVAGAVRACCRDVLGVSRKGETRISKDTWWWEESVQGAVRAKKEAFKQWKGTRTSDMWNVYKKKKKEAKCAVAKAKANKYEELYERLGTREGEKEVYKIAKARGQRQKDVGHVRCMKDEQGKVLTSENEIQERWRSYFAKLMNEGAGDEVQGTEAGSQIEEIQRVTFEEVESALRKMKKGKAVGRDGIPAEL